MEKKNSNLCEVQLKLDSPVVIWGDSSVGTKVDCLSCEMSFSDYISLMRDIKMKAFISFGTHIINKMHIVEVKSSLSPHVAMTVSDFIHLNRTSAFDQGRTWEELYDMWCEELPEKFEENKKALSLNKNK